MERLQDIVTTKTRKWLATLSDGKDKDPPIQQCTGCHKTAEERGGGEEDMVKHLQRRPGRDGC